MTAMELLEKYPEVAGKPPFSNFFDKGRAEEARALVLRQGRKKFGEPTAEQAAALAAANLAALEALADRLLDVSTWADLLAAP